MRWTKAHSKNAVTAKERLRIARALAPLKGGTEQPRARASVKVRFVLTIEDTKIGDKLRLSLYELPWRGRFVSTDGKELSSAAISRAVQTILNHD